MLDLPDRKGGLHGCLPWTATHASIAATGHKWSLVRPKKICNPYLKGSVFEALMHTLIIVRGWLGLYMAISARVKWYVGSQSWADGEVISPDLRKPKKHVVQAAQSMMLSKPCRDFSHTCCSLDNIVGVIGNLGLNWFADPSLLEHSLFPTTCCNVAISPTLGSPRLKDSCKCHTPHFIVPLHSPSAARATTKCRRTASESGTALIEKMQDNECF